MKTTKLTKAQSELLALLQDGATLTTNRSSVRGHHTKEAWVTNAKTGMDKRVSIATVYKLEKVGLVQLVNERWTLNVHAGARI